MGSNEARREVNMRNFERRAQLAIDAKRAAVAGDLAEVRRLLDQLLDSMSIGSHGAADEGEALRADLWSARCI